MTKTFKNHFLCNTANKLHLQLRSAGYGAVEDHWSGTITNPSFTHLYYILKGTASFTAADGTKHLMTAGNCYLLPAGYTYSYALETPIEHLYFDLKLCSVDGFDLLKNCRKPLSYTFPSEKLPIYLSCTTSSDLLNCLMMKQELYVSIFTMVQKYNISLTITKYSPQIQRVITYICSNLSLQLSVHDISDNVFLSVRSLTKKFKAETGMTLGSYITNCIMSEAEHLLLTTDSSLQEISETLGFSDQSYFARWFKKLFGMTPTQYRQGR
ncbi:MAG: AraC family transcriptional regulator [Lachnospiraceae bacterium]|nr:AraC family transcriptional regulator [Lachnospiraceae bacterium]